jgi:sarcosine oxidase
LRVAVIGAGVFGAWSAKYLADAGHRVTLIDAYGPANARASSADHSRVIRAGYGPDDVYSRWAMEALREWQWLSDVSGQSLLARTGALFMGEPGNTYIRDTHATLTTLGIAAELLDPSEVQRHFPQIDVERLGSCVYEPKAGVIRARAAVQALVAVLVSQHDVAYVQARVQPMDEQRVACSVTTGDGAAVDADAFVFACGPWLPKMFSTAIGGRIRVTRQEVLYFGAPAGDLRFAASRLPVWIDFGSGLYGIPDLDATGFKVGIDRHGPPIDPDTLERIVDTSIMTETREWIAMRFPGMQHAPLVDAHVCQYENTSSGDFVIDRHPQWPECWMVGGGSGHGFKHGPAVGRHVAALIDGAAAVQQRFALTSKAAAPARAVY